jgi:acetyl-CoA carboxylase carboxyltransferase component
MSKLEELRQKNEDALLAGGREEIDAQHRAGKKTARERVAALLDDASFVEIDKFIRRAFATPGFEAASAAGEGVVCGYGTVTGRPVFIFAQDHTVLAGSFSAAHARKIEKALDMAAKNGVPVIGILDSDGARVSEGVAAIDSCAAILKKLNDISGVVPTVTVVAGNCIGAAAYIAATTDFCFTVAEGSLIALHGPQIYASTLGDGIDVKTAFNADAHNGITGVSQFMADNEDECFAQVKRLLGFLPANNLEEGPYLMTQDDLNRRLQGVGEGYEYDPKALISMVADDGVVLEYQRYYSPDIITMFGRLNGSTVGFIANGADGGIQGHAARKAARFVSLLDAYNIPVITFTNCGGTAVEDQKPMLISNGARLIAAYAEAGVPLLNVVTGRAEGDGFAMMCPKSVGADIVYAWPEAVISAMPPEAGAIVMYEDEIAGADDGVEAKRQMIRKYKDEYANPWRAAEQGVVDDVIDPAQTRQMLAAALEMCLAKRDSKLAKKHNVLPL